VNNEFEIIIIGAGASGLMLASLLNRQESVLLLDNNSKAGAKIAISGGGKCNITNTSVDSSHYNAKEWFANSVLSRFDNDALLKWLYERGLEPELRDDGKYFCINSSREILDIFSQASKNANFLFDTTVQSVSKTGKAYLVQSNKGNFGAKNLIVASGGLSFTKLGASGIGYDIAKHFGHTIIPTVAALVGLTLQKEQFFFKELSGISVEVNIRLKDKTFEGNLLFAHKGISGPAVLNASLYWSMGSIEIDFVPKIDWAAFRQSQKNISTLLPLPKRVAKAFIDSFGLMDKPAYKLNDDEFAKLQQLSNYTLAPAGTFGYSKAEATKGGVSTDEIDPYNMMSLKEPNLFFVGEVVDVTGELGGYNLQWAFSSAYVCAEYLNK